MILKHTIRLLMEINLNTGKELHSFSSYISKSVIIASLPIKSYILSLSEIAILSSKICNTFLFMKQNTPQYQSSKVLSKILSWILSKKITHVCLQCYMCKFELTFLCWKSSSFIKLKYPSAAGMMLSVSKVIKQSHVCWL